MANCRLDPQRPANPADHESTHVQPDADSPLAARLDRIESMLGQILELVERGQTIKEFYSTEDVARLLGREPFTVREWARLGRVHAVKRQSGRGRNQEWAISHDELERIRNHGLLPFGKP